MISTRSASVAAPGRFSFVPALLFVGATLLSWSMATQRLAAAFAYPSAFGVPWAIIGRWAIYPPWRLFLWSARYSAAAPELFRENLWLAAAGPATGIGLGILYTLIQARRHPPEATKGPAKWGTTPELKKAGLLVGKGIVIGKTDTGLYVQHDGPQHVLTVAPTRSGKGVGQIIPTLLIWPESVVVHDIKGENWDITAGARARFSRCLYFNPIDRNSCRYNPLAEIRDGDHEVADAQNVAQMLVDPDGKGLKQHWDRTAFALLTASILHLRHVEDDKNLAGLANLLADPKRDVTATLNLMLVTTYRTEAVTRVIRSTAREMLQKEVRELSAVVSTALGFLSLYRDPVVAMTTATSDFRLLDLTQAKVPLSLYIIVPPADLARLKPLLRLLWSQIGGRLMDPKELPKRKRRVLLMIDEFPSLGRLEFIATALAFMASFGLLACLIVQSLKQLAECYGRNHSIFDNCHVRMFFTPNDLETATEISRMLGDTSDPQPTRMYSGHRLALWLGHVLASTTEVARPLLAPSEVLTFDSTRAIVFINCHNPVQLIKVRYYAEPDLKRRLVAPPAPRGDKLHRPRPGMPT